MYLSTDRMPCCRKTEKTIRLLEENHPKGKVAMAITLGSGTMVREQRIVMMVGETIGKSSPICRQGAAAEPVTRIRIGVADLLGSRRTPLVTYSTRNRAQDQCAG